MSTKDIRQLVTTPTHAIVSDGIVEASNVGYRPLGDFKANLGLGTSLTQTANNGNGTAAAPAFTFTGDPDTGIFRPAADALGLVTNGSEKVRITSAGNVGIGVSTPSALLEARAISTNAAFALSGGSRIGNEQTFVFNDTNLGSWGGSTRFRMRIAIGSVFPAILGATVTYMRGSGSSGLGVGDYERFVKKEFFIRSKTTNTIQTQISNTILDYDGSASGMFFEHSGVNNQIDFIINVGIKGVSSAFLIIFKMTNVIGNPTIVESVLEPLP
jgi:hypothetical protein